MGNESNFEIYDIDFTTQNANIAGAGGGEKGKTHANRLSSTESDAQTPTSAPVLNRVSTHWKVIIKRETGVNVLRNE